MTCVNTQAVRHTVAILGSGITGLSAAYYISRKFGPSVRPVLFESSNRTGGWIHTVQDGKNIYELGPRTIRPFGPQGMNTLDLIEEIGLDSSINYVPPDHPAAKNRMIYLDGKMIRLPTDMSILFKTKPPFERPLYKNLLKEIFIRRKVSYLPQTRIGSKYWRRVETPVLAFHFVNNERPQTGLHSSPILTSYTSLRVIINYFFLITVYSLACSKLSQKVEDMLEVLR